MGNHLDDLSRQDPDLTVATARRWLSTPSPETAAVVRRGLRTLVKQGHLGALALQGYAPDPAVAVGPPTLAAPTVAVGGTLRFEVVLEDTGEAPVPVAVDYLVHHVKADGSRRPKVFKLTTRTLAPGEKILLSRAHSFKRITARTCHPGEQLPAVQVNGEAGAGVPFELTAEER